MQKIASQKAIKKSNIENIEIEDPSAVKGILTGLLVSIPIWCFIIISETVSGKKKQNHP